MFATHFSISYLRLKWHKSPANIGTKNILFCIKGSKSKFESEGGIFFVTIHANGLHWVIETSIYNEITFNNILVPVKYIVNQLILQ